MPAARRETPFLGMGSGFRKGAGARPVAFWAESRIWGQGCPASVLQSRTQPPVQLWVT